MMMRVRQGEVQLGGGLLSAVIMLQMDGICDQAGLIGSLIRHRSPV